MNSHNRLVYTITSNYLFVVFNDTGTLNICGYDLSTHQHNTLIFESPINNLTVPEKLYAVPKIDYFLLVIHWRDDSVSHFEINLHY